MSKLRVEVSSFASAPFIQSITRRIRDYFYSTGAEGVFMGISGGIDSCVSALLCSRAIKGSNVHAIYLPERETYSQENMTDINRVAQIGDFKLSTVEITRSYRTLLKNLPMLMEEKAKGEEWRRIREGNLLARMRMSILYYYANTYNYIVCGTSDKSEWILGYYTKYGDGAADFLPLGSIYKTQVRSVARALRIGFIALKPSSPGFWPGHLAEQELPAPYQDLDPVLLGLEKGWNDEEIGRDTGIDIDVVKKTREMVERNSHKRNPPIILYP
jgi:NAD+ synthase